MVVVPNVSQTHINKVTMLQSLDFLVLFFASVINLIFFVRRQGGLFERKNTGKTVGLEDVDPSESSGK